MEAEAGPGEIAVPSIDRRVGSANSFSVAGTSQHPGDVRTRRLLEELQPEGRDDGQKMIENIRLNILVPGPLGGVGEAVNLDGQPLRSGGQLAHQKRHVLVNVRMILQIIKDVGAKSTRVGQPALVHLGLHFGSEARI